MKTKTITFTGPAVAEILENEIGLPDADQVQVQMVVSTISSGTERSNLVNDPNIQAATNTAPPYPKTLGYSSSGIVTAVGENVTEFAVGDRVAMSWTVHTQYININKNFVYKLDDNTSFEDAAIFHIGIFPLAAIRKCRLEIGESAIVMGMGVLGLVALPLLKAAGAAPIIAIDPMPEKRKKALNCGADYAFDPYDPDFATKVKAVTNGGAKVGIEVTGIGAGLDGILDCMARFGRVALLGCTRNKNFTIDYYQKVHCPGITLIGAHTSARPAVDSSNGWWTQPDDAIAIKKLTEMGRLRLSDLIDETHSPAEAPEIYKRLANEKAFPFVQFDWRKL